MTVAVVMMVMVAMVFMLLSGRAGGGMSPKGAGGTRSGRRSDMPGRDGAGRGPPEVPRGLRRSRGASRRHPEALGGSEGVQ